MTQPSVPVPAGPPDPRAATLEIRDLVVRFGGITALAGVSLDVFPGELRAVIGPNGAGKTTLFNAVTGLVRPSGGRVLLRGQDVTGLPPHQVCRRGVSRTFQITNIFPELSVGQNVWLGVNAGVRMPWNPLVRADQADRVARRAAALCGLVGLGDKMNEPAANLSHGDQRLLEIAIALSPDPEILLLDEPTQGVSPGEAERVMSLISAIAASKVVLLIEHNMGVVLKIARFVTVLDHGRVIAEGAPAAVVEDRNVQAVYLGIAGAGHGRPPGSDRT